MFLSPPGIYSEPRLGRREDTSWGYEDMVFSVGWTAVNDESTISVGTSFSNDNTINEDTAIGDDTAIINNTAINEDTTIIINQC